MPEKPSLFTENDRVRFNQLEYKKNQFGLDENEQKERDFLAEKKNAESNVVKQDKFKSSHFDEPNILAHVRFDERTVNGEKVLFIEEFQSDFSQSLKKKEDEFKKLLKENPEKVLDMFKKSGKLEVLCP